jgi:hypothetical protein
VERSNGAHAYADARQAWRGGDWRRAKQAAQGVLAGAVACRDERLEASASLLLGQALILESRFEWATRFVTRACDLFRRVDDNLALCGATLALS